MSNNDSFLVSVGSKRRGLLHYGSQSASYSLPLFTPSFSLLLPYYSSLSFFRPIICNISPFCFLLHLVSSLVFLFCICLFADYSSLRSINGVEFFFFFFLAYRRCSGVVDAVGHGGVDNWLDIFFLEGGRLEIHKINLRWCFGYLLFFFLPLISSHFHPSLPLPSSPLVLYACFLPPLSSLLVICYLYFGCTSFPYRWKDGAIIRCEERKFFCIFVLFYGRVSDGVCPGKIQRRLGKKISWGMMVD